MSDINYHRRQELMISPEASALIKKAKILVIGVGAGGNEVLKNLLLMGFGNFTIIDFDTVEDSNLSRTTLFRKEDIGKSKALTAAERLKELSLHDNPNIVGLHGNLLTDFGKGLFIEHDIVISCVDTQKCRAFINDWCVRTKTPFFEMGFQRFDVNVSFFAPVGQLRQKNGEIIDKMPSKDGEFPTFIGEFPVCLREEIGFGDFDVVRNSCSGFKVQDKELAKIPTIQVAASMAGTLIATEVIKFLSGIDSIRNKILFFSGLSYETLPVGYRRHQKCTIHDEHIPIETIQIPRNVSIGEVLNIVEDKYGCTAMMYLPDSYVIEGTCHGCGKIIQYNKRNSEIYDQERWCEDCRKMAKDSSAGLELNFPNHLKKVQQEISLSTEQEFLNLTLKQVGVPDNDILRFMLIDGENISDKYIYLKEII